jgi:hypothetical protein
MASCAYCGEGETRLYYRDTPVCLKCADLPWEERMRRREAALKQASPSAEEDTRPQSA